MLSARKQVRIISLGEIVTPDIMKTIRAYTALIAEKKHATNPIEIGNLIGLVLQQNMNLINDFKLGALSENDFTEQMINALEKATGIKLSVNEFDDAWNAMNPKFEQFEALLKQAIDYNSQHNQQIIFVSFTNPKDIRNLIQELERNNKSCQVIDDQLIEIGGIQLHTTYTAKQTKAELIEATIKRLNSRMPSQSNLANSMSNIFSLEQAEEKTLDIKYIRGVNDIKDPILKDDLDNTNQEIEKKVEGFRVETIIWMKKEQALSDVLSNQEVASRMIVSSNL